MGYRKTMKPDIRGLFALLFNITFISIVAVFLVQNTLIFSNQNYQPNLRIGNDMYQVTKIYYIFRNKEIDLVYFPDRDQKLKDIITTVREFNTANIYIMQYSNDVKKLHSDVRALTTYLDDDILIRDNKLIVYGNTFGTYPALYANTQLQKQHTLILNNVIESIRSSLYSKHPLLSLFCVYDYATEDLLREVVRKEKEVKEDQEEKEKKEDEPKKGVGAKKEKKEAVVEDVVEEVEETVVEEVVEDKKVDPKNPQNTVVTPDNKEENVTPVEILFPIKEDIGFFIGQRAKTLKLLNNLGVEVKMVDNVDKFLFTEGKMTELIKTSKLTV